MELRTTDKSLIKKLEFYGETKVRTMLLHKQFGSDGHPNYGVVESWLLEQERKATDLAGLRAEDREERSLSISESALSEARKANSVAKAAIILSVITAIIVAVIQVINVSPNK